MPKQARVRGKRSNKQATSSKTTKDNDVDGASSQEAGTRSLSKLELMPTEITQAILWSSLNLNLTSASPVLASKLNNSNIRRRFIFLAFYEYSFDGDDRMSFYHERHGVYFYSTLKCRLINHIMDQAWFSPELVFSCQPELLSKIVPLPLSNLLQPEYKVATKPWTVLQQNAPISIPRWLKELSLLRTSDKIDPANMGHFELISPRMYAGPLHVYDKDRFHVRLVAGPYKPFSYFLWNICHIEEGSHHSKGFAVGIMRWDRSVMPNLRLFDPVTWTPESFALLSAITAEYHPLRTSAEFLSAISAGLLKAISEKFFLTVFDRCKIPLKRGNTRMTADTSEMLVSQIYLHASLRDAQGDTSASTSGVLEWESGGTTCQFHSNITQAEKILTSEHLIKAMQMVCEPEMDIASYYIFCWITVQYLTKMTNQNRSCPEEVLQQIHNLALAADTVYAHKAYGLLTHALDEGWVEAALRKDGEQIWAIRAKEEE